MIDPFDRPEPTKAELLAQIQELRQAIAAQRDMMNQIKRDALNSIGTIVLAAGGEVVIKAEHSQRAPGMKLMRAVLDDGSISFVMRDTPTEPEAPPAPAAPFVADGL